MNYSCCIKGQQLSSPFDELMTKEKSQKPESKRLDTNISLRTCFMDKKVFLILNWEHTDFKKVLKDLEFLV